MIQCRRQAGKDSGVEKEMGELSRYASQKTLSTHDSCDRSHKGWLQFRLYKVAIRP